MKPKILFLTNIHNGDPQEDEFLAKELGAYFEVIVSHPLECEKYLGLVSGVVIRNIWPTHEYAQEWDRIEDVLRNSGLPTFNPLSGKGDNRGKDYLIDLYRKGFPVIPSVDKVENIGELPESEFYWIKPKDSCDGYGDEKLTKAELLKRNPIDYIIQPYEEFIAEPSFFFLDNKFLYAITMPNRIKEKNIESYEPTEDDLAFARKFVDWEKMPYGLQRVDAVRKKDGQLLLTEDEDIAEFLYLFDIPKSQRDTVTDKIISSIRGVFK